MHDCNDCLYGLKIGKIIVCTYHKVQIIPIENASCEKWTDENIFDGYGNE